MNPRSYGEVFVYIAAVTGLAWALGMAAVLRDKPGSWIVAGAVFGVLMALIGTPKIVGTTSTTPVSTLEAFVERMNIACAEVGYYLASRTGNLLVYDPGEGSSFTFGPIKVAPSAYLRLATQIQAGQATLVGPKAIVSRVLQRLEHD